MATTNKEYVVYAQREIEFYVNPGYVTLMQIFVIGFYGSLSAAQDAAQQADNNQNDDVWIVKLEQHRN